MLPGASSLHVGGSTRGHMMAFVPRKLPAHTRWLLRLYLELLRVGSVAWPPHFEHVRMLLFRWGGQATTLFVFSGAFNFEEGVVRYMVLGLADVKYSCGLEYMLHLGLLAGMMVDFDTMRMHSILDLHCAQLLWYACSCCSFGYSACDECGFNCPVRFFSLRLPCMTFALVLVLFFAHEDNACTMSLVIDGCYLVDPASSHMLVSKIKPCIRTTAKAFAKDVFINQERKLGARRRSDTVLVSTINDADQGSADVAFRTPLAPYEKSKSLGSGGSDGAWPFLVGGAICLVNSVNERDLSLLNSYVEVCDALRCSGPHARYTDVFNESIALADRPGKRESSARVDYVPALCTHRPSLLPIEWSGEVFGLRRRGRFAGRDVVMQCMASFQRNSNPGATSAKELEIVNDELVDPETVPLHVVS
ncbi:hypothetical protein VNO77_26654 [Canavalia gladiata]|uniref:Uncharacterized protein n=1 Tax=Canavalia gladiata TaxID=3824 RepID=A0AAN9KSN8_CANGL